MANYPSLAVCGVEGQVCDLAGQSHTISPLALPLTSPQWSPGLRSLTDRQG